MNEPGSEQQSEDSDKTLGHGTDLSIFHWCSKSWSPSQVKSFFSGFWAGRKDPVPEELLCLNHCLSCVRDYHRDRKTLVESAGSKQPEGVLFSFEGALLRHFLTSLRHRLQIQKQRKKLTETLSPSNNKKGRPLPVVICHILKYPFYLFLKDLHDLFVEVLVECLSEDDVAVSQFPGLYLLLIHPNEKLHKWAKSSLHQFGPIQLGDSSDLLRVVNLILSVLKFDLQSDPIMCDNLGLEEPSRRIIVMSHLFSTTVYWQGLHALLNHMDSALMGNVHGEIPLTILNSLLDAAKSSNPEEECFLQKLSCFAVLLKSFRYEIWLRVAQSQEDVFMAIIRCKIWSSLIKRMGRKPHALSTLSEHFGWIEHWAGSLVGVESLIDCQVQLSCIYIYHILQLVHHLLSHVQEPPGSYRHCPGMSKCAFRENERNANRMSFLLDERPFMKNVANLKTLCKIWFHLDKKLRKKRSIPNRLKIGHAGFISYEEVVSVISGLLLKASGLADPDGVSPSSSRQNRIGTWHSYARNSKPEAKKSPWGKGNENGS